MARQARAELTRDAVLLGAAEVFLRLGYANASLNEIINQSHVTKGALYFHFGSKEELARAVIDQGAQRLADAVLPVVNSRVPALEAVISISYDIAELTLSEPIVGAMTKLTYQIGDWRGAADRSPGQLAGALYRDLAARAVTEGDLRSDANPNDVGMVWHQAVTGAYVVAASADDLPSMASRLERTWYYHLPAVVAEDKLPYFREFAARRLRRYVP